MRVFGCRKDREELEERGIHELTKDLANGPDDRAMAAIFQWTEMVHIKSSMTETPKQNQRLSRFLAPLTMETENPFIKQSNQSDLPYQPDKATMSPTNLIGI